jgi:PEP-CTERM motif
VNIQMTRFGAAAVAIAALALPSAASAGLVFDSSILAPAQGFGTAPRDLTLQATGQDDFESGGLGVSATGTIVFGSVIPDGSVHLGNGVSNHSGTTSLPGPLADNQKYGIPTIGALGITSANQIAVLFNATEPQGDSVNVTDLTLKFYTATGLLLGAINGQQNFASTNPGNGVAGFTFTVDKPQQAYVNGLLANGPGTTMALEASIMDFAGGPESFLIYNLGAPVTAVPEPATYALILAGVGIIGFVAKRRRPA